MELTIGKKIKEVFENSGLKPAFVATELNTSIRNLYYDFEKDTLPTDRLNGWCKVLNFNFYNFVMQAAGIEAPLVAEPAAVYEKKQALKISLLIELDRF